MDKCIRRLCQRNVAPGKQYCCECLEENVRIALKQMNVAYQRRCERQLKKGA
jgi:hypothetical protein